MHTNGQKTIIIVTAGKKRKGKEERKKAPLTNNDLPVLPIIGDLVTHAELQEACTSHDEDNNPGHILGPLPLKTADVVYGRPKKNKEKRPTYQQ